MPSDKKKLPAQYDAFRAAQQRELDRILNELETEVSPDKGKELLDGIFRNKEGSDT